MEKFILWTNDLSIGSTETKYIKLNTNQAIKDAYRKAEMLMHHTYEAAMFQLEAMKRKSHIEEKFW